MDFYSIQTLRSIFGPRTFSKKKVFMLTQKVLNWLSHKPQINTILSTLWNRNSFQRLYLNDFTKNFSQSSNYWSIRNVEDYSCMKFKSDIIFMNVDIKRTTKQEGEIIMQSLFKGKLLVPVSAKIWGSWGWLPPCSPASAASLGILASKL